MTTDRLMTEIQRQKKYTEALGESFTFPLFNSKKALESQRKSGYRNTAAAARELVDNAIEAGADRVHIVFNRPTGERKKNEQKDRVNAVAFIDNGSGMIPQMARFALSWGGGTHFDEPDFIGRFGFGLPNASINQARRVEVYTRTGPKQKFIKAWLDISEYTGEGNVQSIPEPTEAELPEFVQSYLDRQGMKLEHGTVVVWCSPDHLSYQTGASMKNHLVDDFGVTYRYLLKSFELVVDGMKVDVVDPLFLDPAGRHYLRPEDGGAMPFDEGPIPVMLTFDSKTSERVFKRVTAPEELNDPNLVAAGSIHVRVARFPLGFVAGRKTKDGIPPTDEASNARFEIRKSRRGMSFVRAGREVETVDVFPRRANDIASGLGEWPLLQGYAYHWAIEVKFDPTLDDVFGITNDKQTVRPIEDFWRLLVSEKIDQQLNRENNWQSQERGKARMKRLAATEVRPAADAPSPAELAAQVADIAIGEKPQVPDRKKPEATEALNRKAQEKAVESGKPVDQVMEALATYAQRTRYRVEFEDGGNGPFYTPEWVGQQVVARINKQHPFFTTLYGTLLGLPGGKLAKEAVDLLILALARGELDTPNEETTEFYRTQRVERWSSFLATSMRNLARDFPDTPEETEEAA